MAHDHPQLYSECSRFRRACVRWIIVQPYCLSRPRSGKVILRMIERSLELGVMMLEIVVLRQGIELLVA